ncbi:hypothetical protein Syun_006504 [Stephania yunnanensis]|uniref:Uncharacterized protein n=1 Tax=Stephania yunnanensis TaxID=152371 RepID=A0AAP0PXM2_9MAGN
MPSTLSLTHLAVPICAAKSTSFGDFPRNQRLIKDESIAESVDVEAMNEESEDPRLTTMSGGSVAQRFVGFAAAAAAAVSLCCESPALAEYLTVAFPVSRTHEVNTVQRTLVLAEIVSMVLCDECRSVLYIKKEFNVYFLICVPDEAVTKCISCGTDFSAFVRKAEVTQRLSHAKESASKPTGLHSHEMMYEEASQVANDAVGSIRTIASCFYAGERLVDVGKTTFTEGVGRVFKEGMGKGLVEGACMTGFGEREEATTLDLAREVGLSTGSGEGGERVDGAVERQSNEYDCTSRRRADLRQGSTEEWQLIREERSCGRGTWSSGGGAPYFSTEENEEVR